MYCREWMNCVSLELQAALLTLGWTWLIVFWSGCRGGWSSECTEQTRMTQIRDYNLLAQWASIAFSLRTHSLKPANSVLPERNSQHTTYFSIRHRIIADDQIKPEQFRSNKVVLFNNNNILYQLESPRNKTNQCDQAAEVHRPNQVPDEAGGQN